MKKTSIAIAVHLVCQFWHHPKELNGIITKANKFYVETGISTI